MDRSGTPFENRMWKKNLDLNSDFIDLFNCLSILFADLYVGLFAYTSSEPGDLNFNQGDVVKITKCDGDWWTGTIGDRTGIFPANYVKKIDQPLTQEVGIYYSSNSLFFVCLAKLVSI